MGKKKILTTENLAAIKEINDNTYQEKLKDGITIKTINGQSILGFGNLEVKAGEGDTNIETLAKAWKANHVYKSGDFVTYNSKLYRTWYDHTSGESFEKSYWEEVSVVDGFEHDFSELNNNISGLSNKIDDEMVQSSVLAPNWYNWHNYVIGDLVMHDNKLYECLDDHYSTDDFDADSSHWKQTSIMASLMELLDKEF